VLQPALEVWARVLSRPEPTRAILDAGRRDVSYDVDLPVPLWACSGSRTAPGVPQQRPLSARVVALSDQHAWVDLAADDPLGVGDWVGLGISHPCTTFDKWRTLLVVDEAGRRVGDVATYF
jgi:D-serine deaminase-like pyridoxal phosphate-dependent protein